CFDAAVKASRFMIIVVMRMTLPAAPGEEADLPGPRPGELNVRRVQVVDRWTAEQHQRSLNIGFEDRDCPGDSGVSGCGQTIAVRTADQHSFRAHTDRFDDIRSTANAAIDEDFNLPVDGFEDFRQ